MLESLDYLFVFNLAYFSILLQSNNGRIFYSSAQAIVLRVFQLRRFVVVLSFSPLICEFIHKVLCLRQWQHSQHCRLS